MVERENISISALVLLFQYLGYGFRAIQKFLFFFKPAYKDEKSQCSNHPLRGLRFYNGFHSSLRYDSKRGKVL